jgi:hypothetical protein
MSIFLRYMVKRYVYIYIYIYVKINMRNVMGIFLGTLEVFLMMNNVY